MSAGSPPPDGSHVDRDEVEESLNEALSNLEQMLTRHSPAAAKGRSATTDEETDQYTIPLLDEVVIPGDEEKAKPSPAQGGPDAERVVEDDEPALRRRLAARLASEVEVMVQDRLEAAMESAREEIREQVRNHLDIILPEIVEELIALRNRRDDG